MLKILSIVGYFGMIGGLLGLVALRAALSVSPFVIAVQVAALLLAVWARLTFRRRSYHVAANPTEGGLVTSGPYHFIHTQSIPLFVFSRGLGSHLIGRGEQARAVCW